jgi:hypothetical protein
LARTKKSTESGQLSSWIVNGALALVAIAVLVLGYGLAMRFLSPSDPLREQNPGGFVGEILQVEVVNGCGVAGLAASTTQYLRQRGFDVVAVGNHSRLDEPHSLVLDRVGDPEAARKIAEALGIDPAYVREDLEPSYYLDATVVLGLDYRTLTPFRDLDDPGDS